MQLTIPRALGVLAGVWALRNIAIVAEWDGSALATGAVWVGLWGGLSVLLWLGRRPWVGGSLLTALSLMELVLMQQWPDYALIVFAWAGLCLTVTQGSNRETALAFRVLVSTVYIFGALSKLQPSWLAGENMRYLVNTRPQAEILLGVVGDPGLLLLAVGTVCAELWIGVGLWFRRTRVPTAVLGVLLHAALLVLATRGGVPGALHLTALNFGLVLLYVSYWTELGESKMNAPAGAPAT